MHMTPASWFSFLSCLLLLNGGRVYSNCTEDYLQIADCIARSISSMLFYYSQPAVVQSQARRSFSSVSILS
jgi:hypothetical protein